MDNKTCTACGSTFGCGRNDAQCWCSALPALPAAALDAGADCLCPRCLALKLEHVAPAPTVSAHAPAADPPA